MSRNLESLLTDTQRTQADAADRLAFFPNRARRYVPAPLELEPEYIDDVTALEIATDEADRTPEMFADWIYNATWTQDPQPLPLRDIEAKRARGDDLDARELIVLLMNVSDPAALVVVRHELREAFRAGRADEIKARAAKLEGAVL